MKKEIDEVRSKTLDTIGNRFDKAAQKHEDKGEHKQRIVNGEEPLLKVFPYYAAACAIIAVAISIPSGLNMDVLLENICYIFIFGFMVLGIHCSFMMPGGIFSRLAMLSMALLIAFLLAMYGSFLNANVFLATILMVLEQAGIIVPESVSHFVAFLIGLVVLHYVPIGVCTVVSAYLRKFIPRLLGRIRLDAKNKKRGAVENFFMIPTIIDVKDVTVEPPEKNRIFDTETALQVTFYNVLMCMFIASYFFLSPFFIDMMTWQEMVVLMIILAMFIPVFTLIWQEIRLTGAKIHSDAPRPYELWEGAKFRLFSTFAALGIFMTMVFVAAYFGYSVWDMMKNYLFYLLPTALISFYYGVLFANTFAERDANEIKQAFDLIRRNDSE